MLLTLLAILVVALLLQLRHSAAPPTAGSGVTARDHRDADTPEALAEPRRRAALPLCPSSDDPGPAALRGVVVECAADGSAVELARAVAGHQVVLNIWAYWCTPCQAELPALAEYQRRTGATVLTVHQDQNETAGLLKLAGLGVRLPTLQDGRGLVAAALSVPAVIPATVVLAPDGTVTRILPRAFTSADEIAAAVDHQA